VGRVMCRAIVLVLAGLASASAWAGAKWTQPTPDELKMTSDPAAPGAAAVYLNLEETTDDQKQERTYYARIKILTDDGKQYGDVKMPYWAKQEWIRGVEGRTIHSDGSIVPFSGKPWEKELVKAGGLRYMEKGFSMPDVQVGSILEFRYTTGYSDWQPPQWYLQQPIFVHEVHYHFMPGGGGLVLATRYLPPNAQVDEKKGWDLRVANVPAQIDEDDSPPLHSQGYRVLFYYMSRVVTSADQYWAEEGAYWSAAVDLFAAPDKLKAIVAQIVTPADSEEQKLRKIYAAVMKLENTDFTREHTQAENKAEKVKVTSAADVWQQQRGNRAEITLLFIGMARAAGLKAFAMRVTNRDENVFSRNETDWSQLDDTIAIVNLGGIDTWFDPGDRYCEFGKMHWRHTWTMGVRQTDKGGTEIAQTPYPVYSDTDIARSADLQMDADGQLHGTIRIVMTGSAALYWREEALETDEEAARKDFSNELTGALPAGLTLKIAGLTPLDTGEQPLTATLEVSGSLGTRTGKRIFLPGNFFEAQEKPRFVSATRQNPVYLHYAYTTGDQVKLTLPATTSVEILPKTSAVSYAPSADYAADYRWSGNTYQYNRRLRVSKILYQTKDYPELRDFFQKVNAQDQTQLVLVTTANAAAQTTGSSK
jgi:hypothetical protein